MHPLDQVVKSSSASTEQEKSMRAGIIEGACVTVRSSPGAASTCFHEQLQWEELLAATACMRQCLPADGETATAPSAINGASIPNSTP